MNRRCRRCSQRLAHVRGLKPPNAHLYCADCYEYVSEGGKRSSLWVGDVVANMRALTMPPRPECSPVHVVMPRDGRMWCLVCGRYERVAGRINRIRMRDSR